MALGLFVFLSFITYHQSDSAWSHLSTVQISANLGGKFGALLADVFLYLFGYIAYVFPLAIVYSAWLLARSTPRVEEEEEEETNSKPLVWIRLAGLILILLSGCSLFSLHLKPAAEFLPNSAGGILGDVVGPQLNQLFNSLGTTLVLLASLLCGITLFAGVSWFKVFAWCAVKIKHYFQKLWATWRLSRMQPKVVEPELSVKRKMPFVKPILDENDGNAIAPVRAVAPLRIVAPQKPIVVEPTGTIFKGAQLDSLPGIELLDSVVPSSDKGYSEEVLAQLSEIVERTLAQFGIDVKVVAAYPGPVITRFELDLAPGIKVSKLSTLSKDIARALSLSSVRIVEVIPGKSFVGIEIPNKQRESVRLSEIFASAEYTDAKSPLSLGLGKNIAGHSVVVNLEKMPHLLVAGTTGSGKSVGLNVMLLSLLYKNTPDSVRLILVDPKMLELAVYDGIPHLLTPVITDMKKAANALRWSIAEMERRYRLMASLGVRNINGYNQKVADARDNSAPLKDPLWQPVEGQSAPELEILPFIVLLIDEFADLMMVVGKKIDELIARLAQKARAAGIHLILATQRPSVDVVTGLIKANIPTRIAFQVSSRIDSRTILDQMGAEQLLGHGDMLYLEAGMGHPIRVHGAYVTDEEVHKVVDDLKAKGNPVYLDEVTEGGDNGSLLALVPGLNLDGEGGGDELDPLFDQAVDIVARSRRASISSVQRRLKIGYNRAARLLEQMEVEGMVSPMGSNGMREVLLPVHADADQE
ncbi:MAG: DNA translocase FtsK [Gammaproteobacteria bacterium]|nr:DNA translocase FtsK [Gammaproteobacteria bacterium]